MRIFAVDANNDLHQGADGHLAQRTGLAAFSQACEHAMQSLLGEMVFSTQRGLPYFEVVWSGAPNLRAFEEAARSMLLSLPGALEVAAFNCELEGDALRYQAVIRSEYGMASAGGSLNA